MALIPDTPVGESEEKAQADIEKYRAKLTQQQFF
jgi:hypothetical protein